MDPHTSPYRRGHMGRPVYLLLYVGNETMKLYPSYESLPANPVYLGSDDFPGELNEHTANMIDDESWGKPLAYIVDANGFRSFFTWGMKP